ncbi:MAG TPA: hypothetical protein VLT33_31825 [Labilithrix sp.]|nr:hypothetical protein [Labilithrix sp.]
MRLLEASAILSVLALVAGCSSSSEGTDHGSSALDRSYDVCGGPMTGRDLAKVIDGNLFVAGIYREQGRTSGEMAASMAFTMALNGIDFSDPSPIYRFEHGDGQYSFKNHDAGWTISLYWAKDFETHHAGDRLTEDVFSTSSYAKNIRLDLSTGKVRSDPGPLASLVDGDIDYDAANPLEIHAKARLRGDLVALELTSVGIYQGAEPRGSDVFTWHISTLRATIAEIANQAKSGAGYGLSFADSTYRSTFFGVEEDFGAARVMVVKDQDKFHLEGPYDATLRTAGRTFYQRGLISTRAANQTEYFCDQAKTKRFGVANHALDLSSGTFVVDADGSTIPYGLSQF